MLSRRMKEEFRHAGVSQLRHDGEEQQSPTSYAEDKTERVADRIVSETGSGAVRAVESGRQLFVDHLRQQKTTGGTTPQLVRLSRSIMIYTGHHGIQLSSPAERTNLYMEPFHDSASVHTLLG